MNTFILFITLLIFSNLFSYIFTFAKISPVMSLFIFGLLISNSYLKSVSDNHQHTLTLLGDLGLLVIMFLVGLETTYSKLMYIKKKTLLLSLFSFIFPLICGFLLFYLLGNSLLASFIGGLVMTVTAEAINGQYLMEKGILNTDVGVSIIGIGLLDDILSIICLSILLFAVSGLGKDILIGILIIVAFFAGIYLKKRLPEYNFSIIHKVLKILFVPFFFISMGLYFNFGDVSTQIGLIFIVSIVAIVSKVGSALISKLFTPLSLKQLHIIGWGISSRGIVGLALAMIALRNNLISRKFYSLMISMILITIITFFFVFSILVKDKSFLNHKKPNHIENESEQTHS